MTEGVVTGGWGFIWAVFGTVVVCYGALALYAFLGLRASKKKLDQLKSMDPSLDHSSRPEVAPQAGNTPSGQ